CKDLPGAWSESLVAHESMLVPVPDSISDKLAAIFEPLSVGLHAVLRQPPEKGEHVLVIGGGMIAYTVIAAIRLLGIDCQITQLSMLEYQKEMGLTLGVDQGITNRKKLTEAVLQNPETTKHKPTIGKEEFLGGFDTVYDCIGSEVSLDDALRMTRGRGKVTLVGCAGELKKLDWTFVWANELNVLGTHAYSKKETWQGKEISTMELLLQLIQEKYIHRIKNCFEFNRKKQHSCGCYSVHTITHNTHTNVNNYLQISQMTISLFNKHFIKNINFCIKMITV